VGLNEEHCDDVVVVVDTRLASKTGGERLDMEIETVWGERWAAGRQLLETIERRKEDASWIKQDIFIFCQRSKEMLCQSRSTQNEGSSNSPAMTLIRLVSGGEHCPSFLILHHEGGDGTAPWTRRKHGV
jgi:hypothetical protein